MHNCLQRGVFFFVTGELYSRKKDTCIQMENSLFHKWQQVVYFILQKTTVFSEFRSNFHKINEKNSKKSTISFEEYFL
ncbi:hypothetical protein EBO34_04705 [Alteribacter keqinensis]|uniref:Uncharacterized protein n=1 Tax=Alteribacter keqinensis TaxID=2483800 RepID=A0A3M7TVG7_9BACI|nr:hypothetical protein EBO34_04705 [Alteribacter keqinensis]